MKTISKDDLRKKVLKGKASPSVLPKPKPQPIAIKPDDSLKKLAESVNNFASKTEENTRIVMSLVDYMKQEKQKKNEVTVNVPEVKYAQGWKFKVNRNNKNLIDTVDATRVD